ncbi:ATP-binding protein [Dokdonella fugitiva]|jgi:uncharacterized protein (TIGR00290 family)|uniref:Dph6-related ATP pyrophosphatase n=1 Tax=Dokdonella fugitiva TaxID=328517 RepID=UPI0015FAE788|nr:ATP-binding protein [Dokdonella fugitiva]MBA8882862.1 uncharacterized protein (TIGR00290 family) [Dokdonella fugitiva]
MSRPLLVAWSGGKDAAQALERLRADPAWRVAGLLTSVTVPYDRISIHGVRRSILHAQARALGLPLFEAELPVQADNATYEASFAAALAQASASEPGLDAIAFGDLFLADVRAYREALLARLGWHGVFPLWGEDTRRLAQAFIARGHRAILCCVDTRQLDATFCGRDYDAALLADLPAGCDPCGENGEFHTCVHGGPLFAQPIELARGEHVLREQRFAYVDLVDTSSTSPPR